ncbi:NAD(P)/FAD-dependent oxidoreductase [Sporosarcina gallistercoris]|uniref:FAD-dependent oxidoreductase n=1 Tax=Sporosarcina gallistercoris TaxID=2762245 RepID=A0ABR8PI02_9BACL|nr:FAD-dependent oxidoreductase [Sporosarcina gallistercoris]MBD7907806.1 FAD-dependent oxidoreductase [Sporosarcina gallistercoris]
MKLTTGQTYWDKTAKPTSSFPSLEKNTSTDILIVGGGMSGTLAAFKLASAGKKVTVIDRAEVGKGSSSANTGLLQYASDTMLSEFVDKIGEDDAVLFYRMCLESMDELTKIASTLPETTGYRLRDSIFYASTPNDGDKLKREYSYLKKHDFPVEYLDHQKLVEEYGIDKPAALRTWHDAEVNPYQFIQALTAENLKMGVTYFEHTAVDMDSLTENAIMSESGAHISFDSIIIATGYSKLYSELNGKAQMNQTFAIATTPIDGELWKDQVMVWETKKPYLYFRTAPGGRMIAGGLDEESSDLYDDPSVIQRKGQEILDEIKEMFPHIDVEIEDAWNSLFGISKDGLPFMGRSPHQDNVYYLLGFEGNGTCYSMAGATIIQDLLEGTPNPYAHIVRPSR